MPVNIQINKKNICLAIQVRRCPKPRNRHITNASNILFLTLDPSFTSNYFPSFLSIPLLWSLLIYKKMKCIHIHIILFPCEIPSQDPFTCQRHPQLAFSNITEWTVDLIMKRREDGNVFSFIKCGVVVVTAAFPFRLCKNCQ